MELPYCSSGVLGTHFASYQLIQLLYAGQCTAMGRISQGAVRMSLLIAFATSRYMLLNFSKW